MMEYDVVTDKDLPTLIRMVSTKIADGWEPIGGIAVNTDDRNVEWFYQAMILKHEVK